MRRDPAIRMAAVAITHGLDPIRLLALSGGDYEIAALALAEAQQLRADRDSHLIKAAAESIASHVVRALSKAIKKN